MNERREAALHRLIGALESVDEAGLAGVLADDVRLRASLPTRDEERSGRDDVVDVMLAWYRDSTDITRVHGTVDRVGDVWHAGWRFTLREAGADLVVEQHAYCTFADGLVASIRLICSGFRPADESAGVTLDALGEGCATLTPRIAAAMRGLASGQVLAVLCDDPAAPDGIAAWSRLTGHEVIDTVSETAGTRFLLRHR
jgi:TusA-related sulfurtransferase/ketosteroid isomerase-like protein